MAVPYQAWTEFGPSIPVSGETLDHLQDRINDGVGLSLKFHLLKIAVIDRESGTGQLQLIKLGTISAASMLGRVLQGMWL